MSTDTVKRLRADAATLRECGISEDAAFFEAAADELERLREALRKIAVMDEKLATDRSARERMGSIARAALKAQEEGG